MKAYYRVETSEGIEMLDTDTHEYAQALANHCSTREIVLVNENGKVLTDDEWIDMCFEQFIAIND